MRFLSLRRTASTSKEEVPLEQEKSTNAPTTRPSFSDQRGGGRTMRIRTTSMEHTSSCKPHNNTETTRRKTTFLTKLVAEAAPPVNLLFPGVSTTHGQRRRKKNWLRRVFPNNHHQSFANQNCNGFSCVDPKEGGSTDNTTPTTCATATFEDETLSQNSPNDSSSSQTERELPMQQKKRLAGMPSLSLSYDSGEEQCRPPAVLDESPMTIQCEDEVLRDNSSTEDEEIVFVLDASSDERNGRTFSATSHAKNEEEELIVPKFDRSEIIAALFPKGHPSMKPKRHPPQQKPSSQILSTDKMAALRRFLRQRKEVYGNLGAMVLKSTCDLASVESPILQASTSDSSTGSNTPPDHVTVVSGDVRTVEHDGHRLNNTVGEADQSIHGMHDSPKIIGMEIAWDPTWELLNESNSPISVPRSKLRTLQDSDDTANCLLGPFHDEESSSDSIDLFDISNLPTLVSEEQNRSIELDFELGFHFDPSRFPSSVCGDEIEIVFEEDSFLLTTLSENKCTTASGAKTYESLELVTERQSERKAYVPWQNTANESTSCLFQDFSESSNDDFSRGTSSSSVLEKLVGLCSKE